ncbi:MAG: hypothetical protein N2383_10795 [Caldilineales bacterium]|nr:hypothetical protein [Caldilineales bacterium]
MSRRLLLALMLLFLSGCMSSTPPTPTAMPSPVPSPTATTMAATANVQAWITTFDRQRLLAPADLRSDRGAETTIVVDETMRYQRMEGFGAAMTDSAAWVLMRVLDEARRDEIMGNLFGPEGIRLSYLRVPMGASDFARRDYTYDDMERGQVDPGLRRFNIEYDKPYILPALRLAKALNPELRFMASPWSAPAWMKQPPTLHGGRLNPAYYQAFADYHVRFVQAYAEEGIVIDALTPQNEPLHTSSSYPTMAMSAAEQATFVRDYLAPALRRAGLSTRILVFDHNWDLVDFPLEVLADPATAAVVDGVAFHCYGGDVSAQSVVHRAHPDKGIWFTECSGGGWSTDFGANIVWNVRHLVVGNFRHWGNSLLLWNLALDENAGPQNGGCENCRGVVTVDSRDGSVTYNEEYYILGHVSRFVRPGAYRIESTAPGRGVPPNVAFLNPDGSLALIVLAESPLALEIAWCGQSATFDLPGESLVTFVCR